MPAQKPMTPHKMSGTGDDERLVVIEVRKVAVTGQSAGAPSYTRPVFRLANCRARTQQEMRARPYVGNEIGSRPLRIRALVVSALFRHYPGLASTTLRTEMI